MNRRELLAAVAATSVAGALPPLSLATLSPAHWKALALASSPPPATMAIYLAQRIRRYTEDDAEIALVADLVALGLLERRDWWRVEADGNVIDHYVTATARGREELARALAESGPRS